MPFSWKSGHLPAELGGDRGTPKDNARGTWPKYEAEYLRKRLDLGERRNRGTKYDYSRVPNTARDTYLQHVTSNVKEESEAMLKKEFNLWLEGKHKANRTGGVLYENGEGKVPRLHTFEGRVGTPKGDWRHTPWGRKSLCHLSGVREYLYEQHKHANNAHLYMNLLAEYGPQDLEQAWLYFKHFVKGKPYDETTEFESDVKGTHQTLRAPYGPLPPPDPDAEASEDPFDLSSLPDDPKFRPVSRASEAELEGLDDSPAPIYEPRFAPAAPPPSAYSSVRSMSAVSNYQSAAGDSVVPESLDDGSVTTGSILDYESEGPSRPASTVKQENAEYYSEEAELAEMINLREAYAEIANEEAELAELKRRADAEEAELAELRKRFYTYAAEAEEATRRKEASEAEAAEELAKAAADGLAKAAVKNALEAEATEQERMKAAAELAAVRQQIVEEMAERDADLRQIADGLAETAVNNAKAQVYWEDEISETAVKDVMDLEIERIIDEALADAAKALIDAGFEESIVNDVYNKRRAIGGRHAKRVSTSKDRPASIDKASPDYNVYTMFDEQYRKALAAKQAELAEERLASLRPTARRRQAQAQLRREAMATSTSKYAKATRDLRRAAAERTPGASAAPSPTLTAEPTIQADRMEGIFDEMF